MSIGLARRVIRIKAEDSPNVELALRQRALGAEPTNRRLLPGVLTWAEYQERRARWGRHQQCVGLDADWYEGEDEMMFPAAWLDRAEERAEELRKGGLRRWPAEAIGVDSAMGGDNTAWAVTDKQGLLWLQGEKTRDTTKVNDITRRLMQQWGVSPDRVVFDAGGGGQVHADYLRREGLSVKTVAFGESVRAELRSGLTPLTTRREQREEHYVYRNRRAQLYGLLRQQLDPDLGKAFALPREMLNRPRLDGGPSLRGQLTKVPIWYDSDGRLYLPPKQAKPNSPNPQSQDTLVRRIGCSPDEAEALMLAVYGMTERRTTVTAGPVR